MTIAPISVSIQEPVASNDMLESGLPISSVHMQAPLLASQILTVLSQDADASRVES